MADHTTITVSKELKEELDADRAEGETWNEYLRRLHGEGGPPATDDRASGLSEDDLEGIRTAFRAVAADLDRGEPDREHADRVDDDRLREIVREEVRRALEDVVR